MIRLLQATASLAILLALIAPAGAGEADAVAQTLAATGGRHARFVWVNRTEPGTDTKFFDGNQPKAQLMLLDTAEGKPRVFQPAGPGYLDPLITRDGGRVIWSEVKTKTAWIADIKTGTKIKLSEDPQAWHVLCTRFDEATKTEWAYAYNGGYYGSLHPDEDKGVNAVYCFEIAKGPSGKQVVWNKGHIDARSFHVSADGKMAATSFPWPKAGIVALPNGSPQILQGGSLGCNPDIAPDNSYRFFYMEGDHIAIYMYDYKGGPRREIRVNTMPGNLGKNDAWRPRWTNDPRFMVISQPLGAEDDWLHLDEVYLARFDAAFTKIETWVQLTSNGSRDLDIVGWIAPAP